MAQMKTLNGYEIVDQTARDTIEKNLSLSNSKFCKSGRKIIMLGDSYGVQNNGNVTTFFWTFFRDSLLLTQNVNFFSSFQSGAGFGNAGFLSQLKTLSNSINNKESITDIFVCGGWNDSDLSQSYGTDTAFNTGVNNFNDYVNSNYPNAQITLAHISWGDPQIKPAVRSQMPISIKRYYSLSSKGWRILTGTEWILHSYTSSVWQSDGAHPNQYGHGLLGMYLPTAFLNGSVNIIYTSDSKTVVSENNNWTLGASASINEQFINGLYTWNMPTINFYIKNDSGYSVDCTGNTFYPVIGSDTIYGKASGISTVQTVTCLMYCTDQKWYTGSMQVYLSNNILYVAPRISNSSGSVGTLTIKYLFIPPLSFIIDGLNS